nr:20s-pre-rrna d-site endonuclease nob1 [Quercus suber]
MASLDATTSGKPVHTLVLDTGAVIRNEPSVSTLLAQAETLVTVPAIISEIKDAATRTRVQTTLVPFLTIRTPRPESIKFVTEFARRTGDLAVLSRPDLQIVALTYEIECERNGGDWRLRRAPGQQRVNGAPPAKTTADANVDESLAEVVDGSVGGVATLPEETVHSNDSSDASTSVTQQPDQPQEFSVNEGGEKQYIGEAMSELADAVAQTTVGNAATEVTEESIEKVDSAQDSSNRPSDDSDSDGGGWITPSNLKKKQADETGGSATTSTPEPKTMQVAVLTTDFAMQNVILQINLNLLSPSLTRVKHLKTFVLRCHACFGICKDMTKQFCPRCGQATLTRVSCSTSASGEFKLHLKRNMQWNTRGDRYSVPKPVHGSTNGRRYHGGGKAGWGTELILAEDQKEYQRAEKSEKRTKERSLMDEDYLPGILTGDRGRAGGRIKIGAGRNVNSKKR